MSNLTIKNSVPLEAIPNLTPEEKQNHTIGLLTSIDNTLKRMLLWSEPASYGSGIEMQYEARFGEAKEFDLAELSSALAGAVSAAPAKPAARKRSAPAAAPVAQTAPTMPAAETTLNTTPVAPAAAPVVQSAPTVEATIETVRAAAQEFIVGLTKQGKNGRDIFSNLLSEKTGVKVLTQVDKSKYNLLIEEMNKILPAAPVATAAFDPLA